MVWRRSALKAYRALLFAYPAEFRHEYGEEMERLFAMRFANEPHFRLWCEALADVALTAPTEHLQILTADISHNARALAKAPGFVLAALLAIVLGVCATTAVFSLVHAVLIRSLPYGHPERLVYMWTPAPGVVMKSGKGSRFTRTSSRGRQPATHLRASLQCSVSSRC